MDLIRALLYLAAIGLVVVSAFPVRHRDMVLTFGIACALTAYALPTIEAGI